jgi:hypothetical protein
MERLGDIGDRILGGEPIESFELTDPEREFVLGYTRRGVEDFFAFTSGESNPYAGEIGS